MGNQILTIWKVSLGRKVLNLIVQGMSAMGIWTL